MSQVIEFFQKLLDTADWPPRWHCGNWTDFHGWMYIISDLMIWAAYFAIPLIILRYITRRRDIRFHKIYFLFAGFILACGSTHLLDAIIFWFPAYRLSALVRVLTATISWLTVFSLIKLLPTAFSLRTAEELESEIDQRQKAEAELQVKNNLLNEAQDIAKMGYWQWNVADNKVIWSNSLYKIYGVQPVNNGGLSYEEFLSMVHPDDREYVSANIKEAFEKKEFKEYFHRIVLPDGSVKTMLSKGEIMLDANNQVHMMMGTGQDVTEMKRTEHELVIKTQELQETNMELQNFAYIASHDLQEPLRKIHTFTNMLHKGYDHLIDERGKTFMQKIMQSSSRMQKLIDDILYFSQFNSSKYSFEQVDMEQVLQEVKTDIELTIEDTKAVIQSDKLPVIEANYTQVRQLFQNLLTNALKFRKEGVTPEIKITCKYMQGNMVYEDLVNTSPANNQLLMSPLFWQHQKFVQVKVIDNGIGFESEYAEKIFGIFQRLHGKSAYEGTGIGLAICKKIVENHHGVIKAEAVPGEGATFTITLPVSQQNYRAGGSAKAKEGA
ncbi:sensor histidine kinase [Aridibaculum aurantiacum]|uniref:sensor histidine kinase n=1 Tax=Aridibaculum aurantiacum TaxID=2810307 RepID=UPI001A978731|nr:ATP-binding protein [Aridibaculum aurantiacum]